MSTNELIEQLIQLLARLVADREITEAQAATIVAYWQARPAAELAAVLPLALAEGVGPLEDDSDSPWLPVLLLTAARSHAARVMFFDALQDAHAAKMARLTDELEAGRLAVAEWQAAARKANAALLTAAQTLGGGRVSVQMQQRLDEIEREQAAYLQRFADQLAAHKLAAVMPEDQRAALPWALWTAAYIARRLASYSGAGRGVFFATLEGGVALGPGWVVRYEARDDDRTCSRCRDAEGYYLPGQGPMPGAVCYGGGACRCRRVPVYDPARYVALLAGG